MIKIRNVSPEKGLEYGKGKQIYHMFVSGVGEKKAINVSFEHNYEDGLDVCLEKAVKAYRDKQVISLERLL